MSEVLRPRTFGELLGQMLSVTFGNIGKLLAIQLIFWAPVFVIASLVVVWLVPAMGITDPDAQSTEQFAKGLFMVALFGVALLTPLPAAASILAVADRFVGQDTPIRDCYGAALRRLLPLIGLTITMGLILMLGMLALCVGYFIVFPRIYIATQVMVLEELGVGASIDRSWRLTQGSYWKVLGLALLIGIVGGILAQVIQIPMGLVIGMTRSVTVYVIGYLGAQMLASIVSAIFTATSAVVIYFELRTRKENLDMEGLLSLVDEIGPGYEKEGEPT